VKNKRLVLIMFLLSLLFSCTNTSIENVPIDNSKLTQKRIEAVVHRSGDNYKVKSLKVICGKWRYKDNDREFKEHGLDYGVVVSFKGNPLGYFWVELRMGVCYDKFLPDGSIEGGCKSITEGDLLIGIPFFSDGQRADIYGPQGKKLFTINLSLKGRLNKNGNCDSPDTLLE
jgi:hypothetical protein